MAVAMLMRRRNIPGKSVPWRTWLVSGLFLCLGIACTFYPTLLTRFSMLQADPGDSRLIHYLLEHSYRWFSGDPFHARLWDPSFFFPLPNVFSFTDTCLTLAPAYWFWRLVGCQPEVAFSLWMMTLCVANYLAAQALLRRGVGVHNVGADFGAFLIAFGNSRIAQLGHQQLLGHFYTLFAILVLLILFGHDHATDPTRRRAWIAMFYACFVMQFYAGYYYGYFLCLGLLIAGVWAMRLKPFRSRLLAFLRQEKLILGVGMAASLSLLLPLVYHYGLTAKEFGVPGPGLDGVARLQSYFWMGPQNLLYGWMGQLSWFQNLPLAHEQFLGLGPMVTAVLVWFLWRYRRMPRVRLLSLTAFTAIIAFTLFPGRIGLWHIWYYTLPGIQGIRVMARMGILLLIPAGVALAILVHRYRHQHRWRYVAFAIAILCCGEQLGTQSAYDSELFHRRIGLIQEHISNGCQAFFVSAQSAHEPGWLATVDAMWASMLTGVPVINGYSGVCPRSELFSQPVIRQEEDLERLDRALGIWCTQHGMDRANISWIRIPLPLKDLVTTKIPLLTKGG
jgi:hypothetical protein